MILSRRSSTRILNIDYNFLISPSLKGLVEQYCTLAKRSDLDAESSAEHPSQPSVPPSLSSFFLPSWGQLTKRAVRSPMEISASDTEMVRNGHALTCSWLALTAVHAVLGA